MRIGYPCLNLSIGCSSGRTFRLRSYSESQLKETIESNLDCLLKILHYNAEHNMLFFRITSDIVPFASHPVNTFNWQNHFKPKFEEIGDFIKNNGLRISMHPDQFTLINSVKEDVLERSIKELKYHASLLNSMRLDYTAKIQIHVGGVYESKRQSTERFVERYSKLETPIKNRLVIENDDRLYNIDDCLEISIRTGMPVLFDVFHHSVNGTKATVHQALELSHKTWNLKRDGVPMVDYSSRNLNGTIRQHADSIDLQDFHKFLVETEPFDFDVMLEIKDKEDSAARALEVAKNDHRFKVMRQDLV